MPILKKGSKQAKDYMAKIRAMKGSKKVVKSNKKVGEVYYYGDGKKVNLSDLKEGNIFEWIMGAGYIEVEYIGLKRNYPNVKLSSSVGINPTYLFQFTDSNRYTALSMSAIKEYLRTIPKNSINGYKKGTTRFIEQGEKPIKNARNYRVTRNKTTLLTKGGTFKNFTKLNGMNSKLNIKVGAIPTYKDEDAAREIQLFADNDSQLYFQRRKPILINLSKKHKKGQYDVTKAAKLWRYYIDAAMQKYNKDFGSRTDKWSNLLSVSDRNILALDYAINTLEEFELGNYTEK